MEIYARLNIQSSVIHNFIYVPEYSVLFVEFNNGGKYYYKGVPRNIVEKLYADPSAGKGYHQWIRGRYEWVKG
jgi:hypothetical protein